MTAIPIAFRTNTGRYTFSGNARLINAYAEQQGEDAKAPMAVLPCPGMVPCVTVTDTPGRGNIFLPDLDCGYSVHSNGVYKYTKTSDSPFTLTATRIGIVPGVDQVQVSRNQADPPQITFTCDAGNYYLQAESVKAITDPDLPETVTNDYGGGYTIYGIEDGRFFVSSIHETQTVDGTDYATAEQYADKLKRIKVDGSDVFIFGETSIEPWRITGNADFPIELIQGSVQKKGLSATLGVVSCDNTLMWPGEDNIFYRFNGYTPQRISTHSQERLIEKDTAREDVVSLSYSFEGHSFAAWTGSNYTVQYDAATQLWNDRQSFNSSVWRARNAVRAWGKTLVQDSQSGKLFYFDADTYTEDSETMIWGLDTPFLNVFPNGGIVDALYIDVKTGVGEVLATAQGFDPILMLSWSVDGGQTFKGNRQLKLGKRGDVVRIATRRLGKFGPQGIQFRLRISDPVIRAIVAMDASVRPLKR